MSRVRLFGTVVFAIALVVGATVSCSEPAAPRTVEIIVPPGTQARLNAGEKVVVMPTPLVLRVGDTLHIMNNDEVSQSVGPFFVRAGEDMRMTYGTEGRYEGSCPLSDGERYEILVEP